MKVLNNQGLGKLANVYWLSFVLAMAVGCSNGGGKKSDPPDTTPTAFSFAAMPEAELGADAESAAVTITGINKPAPVTVSNGEYSINNGAYTSAAGTISNGQSLKVKAAMPDDYEQSVTVTVTVGGVSASFVATTQVEDFAPDNLSFTAATGVALNAVVESPEVVIAGINTPVDVSITNGEYAIDGGNYTSEAGTLENGESIKVRVTASSEFSQTVTAELTVGEVSADFDVTTEAIDLEPDAFSFEAQNNVTVSTEVESDPAVTIAGLNTVAPVSITGGEYSIDGGAYTSDASTIENGQDLSLRTTSSASFSTATTVSVTVGTSTVDFVVTTEAEDTQPDAFTFTPLTGVALSTEIESNSITVAGINSAAAISITGGEYAIDGGSYTSAPGTVTAGQSVTVRLMSSASFSTATSATLVIGGVSADFVATTAAQDLVPDPVSFTPVTGADFGVVVESNAITVSGINDAIDISITGGEYDAGAGYTNLPGTITDGTVVMVRATSSNQPLTEVVATLTLNQTAVPFSVTTKDDDVPPEVSVLFPPKVSMTEGDFVFVRGTASDIHSEIDPSTFTVMVNGMDMTQTIKDDVNSNLVLPSVSDSSWSFTYNGLSADVSSAAAEYEISVSIEDTKGVLQTEVVTVTKDLLTNSFPSDDVTFINPTFVRIDDQNSNVALISDQTADALVTVDLDTGARSIFSSNDIQASPAFETPRDFVSNFSDYIYVSDLPASTIFRIDRSTKLREAWISDDGQEPMVWQPHGLVYRKVGNEDRIYVSDRESIYWVNMSDKSRTMLSNDETDVPNRENPIQEGFGMVLDEDQNRLIVLDSASSTGHIVAVDLDTGQREYLCETCLAGNSQSLAPDFDNNRLLLVDRSNSKLLQFNLTANVVSELSTAAMPNSVNAPTGVWGVATHPDYGYALMIDRLVDSLFAVDLQTGQRVVITKSAN